MGLVKKVGPATEYIAGELRAQQARNGWTFDDIEARTGVDRSTAARALKGTSAIAAEVLVALCLGMDVDLGPLVSEASKRV